VNPPLKYDVSDKVVDLIADVLKERTGLRFVGARRRFLQTRLAEVADQTGVSSLGELVDIFRTAEPASEMWQRVVDSVVTEESSFFRYPQQYDALRSFILPAIASNRVFHPGDRTIRILSAGCSRGQEPYSIAISALEEAETLAGIEVVIYAFDISLSNIERARDAIYSESDLRDLSPERLRRFFEPVTGNGRIQRWRVRDEVRRLVRFQQHNLKEELTGPIFDFIFCRNVTIYFDAADTQRVARNLYDRLVPGGYLFLGHAESYYGILPGLCTVQFGDALVNRKPVR